jgi:hypothetical protein
MAERFRANLYELEDGDGAPHVDFEDAVARVVNLPLERRVFGVNGVDRRLEHSDIDQGCHLLNFVTLRYPGPGRAERDQAAARIGLAPGESYAHESSMLFDPDNALVMLESARPGMGPGAVGQYFGRLGAGGGRYKLTPMLDREARARALRKEDFRSLVMRVALGPGGEFDDDLDNVTAVGHGLGGEFMDIEIRAAPRRGNLLRDAVAEFIQPLLRRAEEGNIERLRLKGRASEDDPYEDIDLLQHREWREREMNVDPDGRNFRHEDRWQALLDIRRDFIRIR